MDRDPEILIIGGGPAGLSAALVLGRCRRRVVLFDGGHHRNDESGAVHGFLTRDGTPPGELRGLGRAELRAYASVRMVDERVESVARQGGGFAVTTVSGRRTAGRRLVLATGISDVRPPIAGVETLHGRKVMPCPYCDGWEHRDRPLGAYSHPDERGARYAALLLEWSRDVVFYTGGPATLSPEVRRRLGQRGITVEERVVTRITDEPDGVRLWFGDGSSQVRDALFYHLGCKEGNRLARQLDVRVDERGGVAVNAHGLTSVAGVYAVGDATRDTLQAIVGAGEGAAAAMAINNDLSAEAWEAT